MFSGATSEATGESNESTPWLDPTTEATVTSVAKETELTGPD
jgi:hypothetical protein